MLAARVLIVSLIVATASFASAQPADSVAGDRASSAGDLGAEGEAPPADANAPSPAQLQSARLMFQRGVQMAQRREFTGAAKKFREALAIHYAPAVEYNLASALYETGHYAEAYNRTQSVLLHGDTNESVRPLAERLERTLRPYVARLTLVTSGEASQIAVRLDGEPVPEELLGVPQAVTPGKHEIVATRGGRTISEREVAIPVRTAAIIDVSVIVAEQEVAAGPVLSDVETSPLAPAQTQARSDRNWTQDWRVWTGVGAGVLAVGVGVALVLILRSDESSSRDKPVRGDSEPGVLTW